MGRHEAAGPGNERVYAIQEDSAGAIWLGSRAGLSRLSLEGDAPAAGVTQRFSTEHGLSNAIVLSVVEDPLGRIWAGTEAGLNLLRPSPAAGPGPPRYAIRAFRHADGLGSIDASLDTVAITPGGWLWWGGSDGSTHLRLDGFPRGERVPALWLDGLDLLGRFVDYRHPGREGIVAGPVPPFESLPASLELSPELDDLTFRFSATDWVEPHRVEYQYRLDEADAGWSEPSPVSRAEYRNTPHGALTFRARARVAGGPWSEPVSFSMTLRPPWWRTTWATATAVLAGLALVGALHRLRLRALLRRQKELETTVSERTTEIQQQRDELARLEFLILLPGSTQDQAARVAEKVRRAIEAAPFFLAERSWSLTASFGVTDTRHATPRTPRSSSPRPTGPSTAPSRAGGTGCAPWRNPRSIPDQSTKRYLIRAHSAGKPSFQVIFFPSA